MATVAQLDKDGFFLELTEDYGGPMPNGAVRLLPPDGDLPRYHRWRYTNGVYTSTADYRATDVYRPDGGTYRPETWGELPEGHSLTPPPPTLEEATRQKLAEVMDAYSVAFAPVEAMYPATEREGWAVQEAEAKAVLADATAETPVLSALVRLRAQEETVGELAARVLANAVRWRALYAHLTGQQQRMYAEVTTLAGKEGVTAEEILAYRVGYDMPEGF